MSEFDPQAYGDTLSGLLSVDRCRDLGPGRPDPASRDLLTRIDPESALAPHAVADPDMARLVLSGLWLLYDWLDDSHTLSQKVKTSSGSYWHAIMHRREGDFSNAKYWCRQTGPHPVHDPLADAARELAAVHDADEAIRRLAEGPAWNPAAFVDLCAAAQSGPRTGEMFCREVQQQEWELLFDHCYRAAVGR